MRTTRLTIAACLATAALVLCAVLPVRAGEETKIQAVIADQIDAFQRDDLAAAFAHASPGIQGIFRNPSNFGRMVAQGYPMIWRPRRYEMGDIATGPRGLTQTVVFEDDAGALWEADYLMQDVEGTWRINGVQLRRLPGVSS
ncbi:MAG: DUF4864 domain-containing protein [Pseudomonadota bacterium]